MNSILKRGAALLTAAVVAAGCAKQTDVTMMEPDAAYRYLVERYEKKDYLAAIDGLGYFTLNYSGSSLVDSAQYYLGRSHEKQKEYLLAAEAYNELVRRFPRSSIAPEAMFLAGACYYKLSPSYSLDQEMTLRAMDALQAFIDYYPERADRVKEAQDLIEECRSKLAHKEFASGVIYIKTKDFPSAIIYFQSVIEKYYDTEWAAEAAFRLGEAYAGDEKPDDAVAAYEAFLAKYPDHRLSPMAETAMVKLQRMRK